MNGCCMGMTMSNAHDEDCWYLENQQVARISLRPGMNVDEVELVLRRTSNEGLLRAFAALTHRLHAARRKRGSEALAATLRTQRDRVQAEVLRRMVDHE